MAVQVRGVLKHDAFIGATTWVPRELFGCRWKPQACLKPLCSSHTMVSLFQLRSLTTLSYFSNLLLI